MTYIIHSCLTCKYYTMGKTCLAYPDEIPKKIWEGENDHTSKYRGDKGVRYEPIEGNKSRLRLGNNER